MRSAHALGLTLLIVSPFVSSADRVLSPSEVFDRASPSIVVVETFDADGKAVALGSGVTIAPGVAVTNCHVFKGARTAQIRYQRKRFVATVLHSDPEHDLCSLSAEGLTAPTASLGAASTARVGDKVYAIGAPQGFELTLSDGLVSSLRPLDGANVLQVTAPISHGSSGGGLFDAHARLIGITTLYWGDSQQLNFAMPVEWVRDLPKRHALPKPTPSPSAKADVALAKEQLKRFDDEMRASDPTYMAKRALLSEAVRVIRETLSPSEWLASTRHAYSLIPLQRSTDEASTSPTPATGAFESDRWRVLRDDEGRNIALDASTVRKEGRYALVWLRGLNKVPDSEGISTILQSVSIECTSRSAAVTGEVNRNLNGDVVKQLDRLPAEHKPIAPESIYEGVFEIVCRQPTN